MSRSRRTIAAGTLLHGPMQYNEALQPTWEPRRVFRAADLHR